ncbi:MAG: hypothetical protein KF861_14915, partial [Planctomycetaceae bacterium]|nr:hypothetical protein [Planctomycetaceae bacterium]
MSDQGDKEDRLAPGGPHGLRILSPEVDRQQHATEAGARGLLPDLLRAVTRSACRRPLSVLWICGLLVALSTGVAVRFLAFKTDRADLIDRRADFQQRWLQYTDRFGDDADA